MIINHNMNAINAHRNMGGNISKAGKAMEKLSSGLRINRAGDDAAGLAISEKMRGQIRGLDQASRNASDSISLIQTAEGALNETQSILQRMRELSTQSSNDTLVSTDRDKIQKEVDQLSREITRIAENTEFNTQKLLNGNYSDKKFHIGANADQNINLDIDNMDAKALGVTAKTLTEKTIGEIKATNQTTASVSVVVNTSTSAGSAGTVVSVGASGDVKITVTVKSTAKTVDDVMNALKGSADAAKYATFRTSTAGSATMTSAAATALTAAEVGAADSKNGKGIDVSSQEAANSAITVINNAINTVSEERSKLGAMQNRLEHTINNLNTSSENLQASESRVRDVDMAKEMMNFSKNNILQQAAQAMLAQANQQPQGVLQLLR